MNPFRRGNDRGRGRAVRIGRHRRSVGRVLAIALLGSVLAAGPASAGSFRAAQTDGYLKVALATPIATIDPHQSRGAADFFYSYNVFEYLYQWDQAGHSVPRLATSFTLSPDGKTYTFKLRPNVKFHDGSPFTANDVKFSFERYGRPDLKQVQAFKVAAIDEVKVINPLTVAITFKKPEGGFIGDQTYLPIISKTYVDKVGEAAFIKKPVGTGPFSFQSEQPGTSLTMKRWEGYWGTKARYPGVQYLIQANARSRLNMLRTGQVDMITNLQPQDIGSLGSGFKVVSAEAGGTLDLAWNMLKKNVPWQNDKVREAISYAIDQKAIVKTILKGYGSATVGGLVPGAPGYKEAGLKAPAYDPAKAKALLKEAGYPNGFSMDVVGVVTGRYPGTTEMTQAIGGYLGDIGIKVNTKVLAYLDWVNAQNRTSDVNGMFMTYGTGAIDYQRYLTSIYTSVASFSHMNDSVLDTLTNNLATTPDPARRAQRIATIAKYIDKAHYMVPLVDDHAIFAMRKSVDWKPWTYQGQTMLVNAKPS